MQTDVCGSYWLCVRNPRTMLRNCESAMGKSPLPFQPQSEILKRVFELGAAPATSPMLSPDLRSRRTQQKETLARVLEDCRISTGSVVDIAISGNTWKVIGNA